MIPVADLRWRFTHHGQPFIRDPDAALTLAVYETFPCSGEWFWTLFCPRSYRGFRAGATRSPELMPLDEAMADGLRFYGEVIATLQKNGPLPDEKQRPNFKDDDDFED